MGLNFREKKEKARAKIRRRASPVPRQGRSRLHATTMVQGSHSPGDATGDASADPLAEAFFGFFPCDKLTRHEGGGLFMHLIVTRQYGE